MFTLKPDYENSKKRIDAFWNRELLDRPVVQFQLYKSLEERVELPVSRHGSARDKWINAEYQAERNLRNLSNQLFLGDSMPVVCPNLGPDVMAAFYGCPLQFSEVGIIFIEPIMKDITDQKEIRFDWESHYLKSLVEITDSLLDAGKDKFITGMSNWHSGGDCVAALLGPVELAAALITNPERVKNLLEMVENDYQHLYKFFYNKLRHAGQPATTWVPLVSDDKFYVVSNDFSIMISADMYRDLFLDEITRECRFLDHSIYHLDGPGALRHLDAILEISELDGVQFVPSPGDASFRRWAQVYKRIQAAGKCIQVNCDLDEIQEIVACLKPEGLYLNVQGVTSEDEANDLIRVLEQWPLRR